MPTWTLKINGSSIDTATKRVSVRKLRVDSRVSDTFEFTEYARHFDGTWNEGQAVVFEYPTGTPRFTGRITEKNAVGSGGAEAIEYRAVGWRSLAQNVVVSRSTTDSYPERIYNCADDDIDKAYRAAGPAVTVGAIIQNLFDTFLTALRAEGACHASATPYSSGELASLTFVPGKLVLANSNFDAAIVALLAEQGPAWSCWVDATGVWHFYDRSAQSATGVTIASGQTVRSNQLRRHVRGRFTAVKVVGKRGRGQEVWPAQVGFGVDEHGAMLSGVTKLWNPALEATWTTRLGEGERDVGVIQTTTTGTILKISGKNYVGVNWAGGYVILPRISYVQAFTINSTWSGDEIELASNVSVQAGDPILIFRPDAYSDVFRLFQVTDTALRDIVIESVGGVDCCPYVEAILFDSFGNNVARQHVPVRLEGDGKFRTLSPMVDQYSNYLTPGTSQFLTDWRFKFCYRPASTTSKLLARYPSSGFSGGASGAPWSIQRELTAVVEEFDDATAMSSYVTLATELHKVLSDVGTSGKIGLVGIDTTYFDPRRRINIAHAADTTGWEALAAFLTSVAFDFEQDTTELELSEDGSSEGINYQAELDRIRARTRAAAGIVEAKKLGDYVNCQGEYRRRGDPSSLAAEQLQAPLDTNLTIVEPEYSFPRKDSDDASANKCRCDDLTDPCNNETQADAHLHNQFICLPDDRHGLSTRHPGNGGNYCYHSQLAFKWDSQNHRVEAAGNYYPFACQGVAIGNAPDGSSIGTPYDGECRNGWRTLVVVEPKLLDDSSFGTEIGIGEFVLQFLRAYDNYMQHNEEAHCCLDNRILCMDEAVMGFGAGGAMCSNGKACHTPVWKALEQLEAQLTTLTLCVNNIIYQRGDTRPNCPLPAFGWDTDACGAC